ncbi:MAG: helix-turn-helix domain-containing protein, partial [Gammaproteobacteria bacterium]|nr:helix-turn-helix domain-containing protein [Gammaproteobacteria bacterium]
RSHVYQLRRTMETPGGERLLHTVHGVGYRLADPDD